VGIGPYTNLHLLEAQHPGSLGRSKVFLMGGYICPTRAGYPDWGNDMDFNVQADVKSAHHVMQSSTPAFIPLSVTVETALRRSHLAGLRKAGPLGELIARQAEAFIQDEKIGERFAAACPRLPADIINFQHDPLACAVALGWRDGVEIEELRMVVEEQDGWLVERPDPAGSLVQVVRQVDGERFNQFWYETVTRR
jgi:inosine-uridine nucleoside N-ribohydrolase